MFTLTWRSLAQCPVRPVRIEVLDVLVQDQAQVPAPLQNVLTRPELQVSVAHSRGPVILIDHTAKHLTALYWRGRRRGCPARK